MSKHTSVTNDPSRQPFPWPWRAFRFHIVGPVLLGLVLGGIPLGFGFYSLGGGRVISAELLRLTVYLSPIAFFVAILGAISGDTTKSKDLLGRACLTSLAACVPIPAWISLSAASHFGYDAYSAKNFLPLFIFFLAWAIVSTTCAWLLSLSYVFLRKRYAPLSHKD